MRDLDLTSLRLFVAACDLRNIARAGEQAHLGASAISKRMAQLEAQVNAPLLERGRRGVVPTAAGEILLVHARSLLAGADRAARDMAAHGQGVQGQVRVMATISSIAERLPDDIAAFMSAPAHARIRVDIEEKTSAELVAAVREGIATLGVCWNAADLEGLEKRAYRTDRLAIAAHPSHPIARLRRCSFEETLGHEHVGLPANTAVHSMLARAAAIIGRPLHYRAVVSTFDASLRCVRAGLGITVVPAEIAEPLAAQGALRVVPLTDTWAKRQFAICFRSKERLSPSAALLLDHLERAGNAR